MIIVLGVMVISSVLKPEAAIGETDPGCALTCSAHIRIASSKNIGILLPVTIGPMFDIVASSAELVIVITVLGVTGNPMSIHVFMAWGASDRCTVT